ncbi:MAG TPA: MmcQ/YjbR family DNA-binding protein, partial [Pyrinomonadaceae bacterium]
VRAYCLSFPHVTETIQWGYDLVFKIGGKMFAVTALEAAPVCLSFKCTPEKFAELVERDSIIPAPYVARYHWVALEHFNALRDKEMKALLRNAYDLVLEKLPKKAKAELDGKSAPRKAVRKRR